ncbi:3020_t:CDS:1, partial [Gigaspora margarita]
NGELMLPEIVTPRGISLERQWYLYNEIRKHIQDPKKRDIYCAQPNQPKPKKIKLHKDNN